MIRSVSTQSALLRYKHAEANLKCLAGLVTKPKPYRVRIVPRSAAHKKVIEDSAALARTDILDFDSVELLS
jgi:hypothetical protein